MNYFKLLRTISKLNETIWNYLKLFETISQLYEIISNYLKLFRNYFATIANYLKLFETIWNYLKLFETIWLWCWLLFVIFYWTKEPNQYQSLHNYPGSNYFRWPLIIWGEQEIQEEVWGPDTLANMLMCIQCYQ